MLSPSYRSEHDNSSDQSVAILPSNVNPFPGLRPFTVDESHLFFGREGQVDDILGKLSANRFVCVMGYSGSGKSSLMSCGLLPVLHGGFVVHSSANWHVITARPGMSPIQNLTESIIDYLIDNHQVNDGEILLWRTIVNSILRSGTNGLVEIAKILQQEKQENVFFLIDQFEELFRFHESDAQEEVFNDTQLYVNLLLHAVEQRDLPVFVALTMRTDFIANCSPFTGLTEVINESNYLVPQMTREQKRSAIEGPVAVAGGKIAERLVKRMLQDLGHDQDQLPILQHALMRTWDYWSVNREPGEPLDLRHYATIGGVEQALSLHANELYDELNTRQKEITEILFKSITEKSAENKGMRRPSKLSLIAELANASEYEVEEVVEHFRQPGRSFLMPAHTVPLNSDSLIELSHESLLRIWTRLNQWVEEEFESATVYKRISDAAAMYQIGRTSLWRPPDLQLALNWQKKQQPTREWAQRYDEAFERAIVFLDTSRITYEAELKNQELLQKRMLQRARATALILGIAAVIAILFLVFAYLQKIEADSQKLEAQRQEKAAIEQREAAVVARNDAEAQRNLVEQRNLDLEKARAELEAALNEAQIARDQAQKSALVAYRQEQLAKVAGVKEMESRIVAERETDRANQNLNIANRLYMLTIAQAMSGKSVQEDDDKDLAGALAMQAFHFHRRYEGKRYDPYIYNALYHALVVNAGKSYNAITVPGPPKNRMTSVAVSSKGNTYYAAGADGRIVTGNFETRTSQPTAYQNSYPNRVIAISKDERYLVNGTDSAQVQIFDLKNESSSPVIVNGLTGATNAIEFLPDNATFLVSKADRTISLVDVKTGKYTPLITLPFEIKTLSISRDGKYMAGGSWTGQLVLITLANKSSEVLINNPTEQILSVEFSPDGKTLAYGTFEINDNRGLVKLYNIAERKDLRQYTGHKAGVYDVEFSPDGKLLASAGADKRLQMWVLDFPEDLPIQMDNNNGFIWDIAFSHDSQYLIAACHESELRVWPTNPDILATKICPLLQRNMTPDEWIKYVGDDIQYETTCVNLLISDY
jgi:WD40 repeat protein/energy-coupling factor transporter ATP-binding protein EcfA2